MASECILSNSMDKLPYIVLLGNVGAGKSTIIEKLTGTTGRSSNVNKSFTLASAAFMDYDEKMIICDTPGVNSMEDQFDSDLNIAYAMNFYPVRCVMIVVKADTRMDNVVKIVREYAECFLPEDLPEDLISVCITHMDKVKWKESELLPHLKKHLDIDTAIFSSLEKTPGDLQCDMLSECAEKREVELSIEGGRFQKIFKFSSQGVELMRASLTEVDRFEKMKQDYYIQKNATGTEADSMNMTFEFQAWLSNEITAAQKNLTRESGFVSVADDTRRDEHTQNMTNQLRKILRDVGKDAAIYNRGMSTKFKRCPYCGRVWEKIKDGVFECGDRPSESSGVWTNDMYTFSFTWDHLTNELKIRKLGEEKITTTDSWCGQLIDWSKMAPVDQLHEDSVASSAMPQTPEAPRTPRTQKTPRPLPPRTFKNWNESFDSALKGLGDMTVQRVNK